MVGTLLLPGYLLTVTLGAPLACCRRRALVRTRPSDLLEPARASGAARDHRAAALEGRPPHARLAVDTLGHHSDALIGSALYAVAAIGSVLGILAVLAI